MIMYVHVIKQTVRLIIVIHARINSNCFNYMQVIKGCMYLWEGKQTKKVHHSYISSTKHPTNVLVLNYPLNI